MIIRDGYNNTFLAPQIDIPLPVPGPVLQTDIFTNATVTGGIVDYFHYSLMLSRSTKTALFSAANVDNDKYVKLAAGQGRDWFVDDRIGKENQIRNYPYRYSRWDRGHLTRRSAVAWGDSYTEALAASNDSCAYTNSAMQHENFNEDEWRLVEELVSKFELASRLCVFSGPIFTRSDRYYTRDFGDDPVRIPAGFWKIVCYIDNQDHLQTQAYVFIQDIDFIKSSKGRSVIKLKNFQVTTTEITCWTGLYFDQRLYDSNPLQFYSGPERISIKNHKKLMKNASMISLDVSIIENHAIDTARQKLPLDVFYNLIKEVSWV